ncbi:hypothetical protein T01_3020, partial [Trichinella spiralis]
MDTIRTVDRSPGNDQFVQLIMAAMSLTTLVRLVVDEYIPNVASQSTKSHLMMNRVSLVRRLLSV